ncbi:hypothetical protein GCM10028824_36700 [Hymenobacter segetis]|uniref:DUF3303 domain-containing protein n=1 Tax=Hymenobacter segetis TaxID=2025509 RepID=A0ABU9LVR3_9BACT
MTLYQFRALPDEAQLATVHETGTYLATRWEGLNESVLLYHLPSGGGAELSYDVAANHITHLRAFVSSAPLEDYAHYITLPEELDELEDL